MLQWRVGPPHRFYPFNSPLVFSLLCFLLLLGRKNKRKKERSLKHISIKVKEKNPFVLELQLACADPVALLSVLRFNYLQKITKSKPRSSTMLWNKHSNHCDDKEAMTDCSGSVSGIGSALESDTTAGSFNRWHQVLECVSFQLFMSGTHVNQSAEKQ